MADATPTTGCSSQRSNKLRARKICKINPKTHTKRHILILNEYLIKQKEATFFVRIKGDSMIGIGIHDNDIVIVDKSQKAITGDIVLASIDGDFTVKLLSNNKSKYRLLAANEKYKPIEINKSMGTCCKE